MHSAPYRASLTSLVLLLLIGCSDNEWQENRVIGHAKLDNGLKIVTISDRRAPIVTHMLWYRSGSYHDPAQQSGMAHFFEHLMFRETKTLKQGEFAQIVARLGGEHNAFTHRDFTAYYQHIARDKLARMMEMEASRMCDLLLNDSDVNIERKVVLEERSLRIDTQPSAILSEKIDAALFANHPYGVPIIGWRRDIERITPAQIRQFYRRHYAPNNAILLLIGDIDIDTAHRLAQRYYGKCAAKNLASTHVPNAQNFMALSPLDFATPIVHTTDDPHTPFWIRRYRIPHWRARDIRQYAALDILMTILAGSETSRLYQKLIIEHAHATHVSSYADSLRYDMGTIDIIIETQNHTNYPTIKQIIDIEIARVQNNKISSQELQRAKAYLTAAELYARDSQFVSAYIYGSALSIGRSTQNVTNWIGHINSITRHDIQMAAQKFLKIEHSISGYLDVTP